MNASQKTSVEQKEVDHKNTVIVGFNSHRVKTSKTKLYYLEWIHKWKNHREKQGNDYWEKKKKDSGSFI